MCLHLRYAIHSLQLFWVADRVWQLRLKRYINAGLYTGQGDSMICAKIQGVELLLLKRPHEILSNQQLLL